MASSGTITGSRALANSPYLELKWSVESQNIKNNSSRIKMELYLISDYAIEMGSRTGEIEGQTFSYGGIYSTGRYKIATKYKTAYHNAEGKCTDTLSGVYNTKITWSGSWLEKITVSGTVSYPDIPRKSYVKCYNPDDGKLLIRRYQGATIKINSHRKSTNFSHKLRYKIKGHTGNIGTMEAGKIWTLPDFSKYMPNEKETSITIYCETLNGSQSLGETSYTFKYLLPDRFKPEVTSISVTRENPESIPSNYKNKKIKNLSHALVKVSGKTTHNAGKIEKYQIKLEGQGQGTFNYGSTYRTNNPIGIQTVKFEARVRDSRGLWSDWKSITENFEEYQKPQISNFKAYRSTSDGKQNPSGSFISIKADLKGTQPNKVIIDMYPVGETLTQILNETYYKDDITINRSQANASISKEYRINISIRDKYNQKTVVRLVVPKAEYTLTLGKENVGINSLPAEYKGLKVNGEVGADGLRPNNTSDGLKIRTTENATDMAFIFKREKVLGNTCIVIEHANGQAGIAFTLQGALAVKRKGTWNWWT